MADILHMGHHIDTEAWLPLHDVPRQQTWGSVHSVYCACYFPTGMPMWSDFPLMKLDNPDMLTLIMTPLLTVAMIYLLPSICSSFTTSSYPLSLLPSLRSSTIMSTLLRWLLLLAIPNFLLIHLLHSYTLLTPLLILYFQTLSWHPLLLLTMNHPSMTLGPLIHRLRITHGLHIHMSLTHTLPHLFLFPSHLVSISTTWLFLPRILFLVLSLSVPLLIIP